METVGVLFSTTLLICISGQAINADLIRSNIKIILTNATSEYDPEYALLEFKSYQDDKQNSYLDICFKILKDLGSDNIYILYQILLERKKNEYMYFVKGQPVDVCKYFRKPHQDPFLDKFMSAINKHGSLLRSCPILKMKFNITLPMDEIQLPSFTPPGNYKYILQMSKKTDDKFHQLYRGEASVKFVKI